MNDLMKCKIMMTFILGLTSLQMFAQEPESKARDVSGQYYHYICDCGCHDHPVNNYSGLSSLLARLADRSWSRNDSMVGVHRMQFSSRFEDGNTSDVLDKNSEYESAQSQGLSRGSANGTIREIAEDREMNSGVGCEHEEYFSAMEQNVISIGAPVYVFFKIGSTVLTDQSQMVNVHAIADVARRWHLNVKITGAADSATGSDVINHALSQSRAEFIAKQIQQRNVEPENIIVVSEGGVSTYSPEEANRYCRIELFL